MRRTHDGQGIVLFPLAVIGRGVHSMVIACVLGSERERIGCFATGKESVEQDYERDRLVGLDHGRVSSVGAQ